MNAQNILHQSSTLCDSFIYFSTTHIQPQKFKSSHKFFFTVITSFDMDIHECVDSGQNQNCKQHMTATDKDPLHCSECRLVP